MAERELKKKPAPQRRDDEVVEEAPATSESGEKLKAELDDLLDEIDDVLETNAEDFVQVLHPEGRRVDGHERRRATTDSGSLPPVTLPIFSPGDDPGPDFAALVRRAGLVTRPCPTRRSTRRFDDHPRHHRASPSATPTAW